MAKIPDKTDIARTYKHEVWSQRRMAEGWTYGPVRDETALRHPCLLPYAELSENERDYDRATAMNAIKMMVKLGFKIEKCE